jgi:diguanylate cyclase (GGDEF)-like protein
VALAFVAVAGTLASVLRSRLNLGEGTADALVSDWLPVAAVFASAGLVLGRSALVRDDRAAWRVIGGGILVWGVAGAYVTAVIKGAADPPFPSLADPLYLTLYPALYTALVLLMRPRIERFHSSLWLDGLIAALGAAALAAALLYGPILSASLVGTPAAVITNLAYPIGDLLLIVFVFGAVVMYGGRPGREWWLLLVGLLALTATDTYYLLAVSGGTYAPNGATESGWPAGMALIAAAAWQRPSKANAKFGAGWALLLPSAFAIGALVLIVYGNVRDIPPVALVLATLTLVAGGARAVLTFRQALSLASSRREARTDELTGLANRRHLIEHLGETISRARETESTCALMIIDLDRFKDLNDTLGHDAGDLLLECIGDRLRSVMRESSDLVARLGGDEFAIVLEPGATRESALALAQRARASMDQSVEIMGISFHVEASIGVSLYPEHGADVPSLMRHADIAMYSAKAARSGIEVYAPEYDSHSVDRLGLLGELRRALDENELVVHYQPVAEPGTGKVVGAEALVRWQHPTRGLLGPDRFLPLVEQTGLMRPLTEHVLLVAVRQCRAWRDAGLDLTVGVNLAIPNLLDEELPSLLEGMLKAEGVAAGWLCLELTENSVMVDPERALANLARIDALGVWLSVDDFGTGYSSLAYLNRLPVSELKIDRSFVMEMETEASNTAIVRSTVALAHELGLEVVAEGVETEEALAVLAATGCDRYQGYLLSRPLPAGELTSWLEQRLAAARATVR